MADTNATKNLLARSMKQLMSEKSFAKISITDICNGCGMNRKSFYYHFKDKYDLMNWIFYVDFIAMSSKAEFETGWDLLEAVCALFYEDQGFYRSALRTEGQNSFQEYLLESMLPIVDFLFADVWSELDTREIIGKMFCQGYITVVSNWLEDGCKSTPEAFVGSIKKFIKNLAVGL